MSVESYVPSPQPPFGMMPMLPQSFQEKPAKKSPETELVNDMVETALEFVTGDDIEVLQKYLSNKLDHADPYIPWNQREVLRNQVFSDPRFVEAIRTRFLQDLSSDKLDELYWFRSLYKGKPLTLNAEQLQSAKQILLRFSEHNQTQFDLLDVVDQGTKAQLEADEDIQRTWLQQANEQLANDDVAGIRLFAKAFPKAYKELPNHPEIRATMEEFLKKNYQNGGFYSSLKWVEDVLPEEVFLKEEIQDAIAEGLKKTDNIHHLATYLQHPAFKKAASHPEVMEALQSLLNKTVEEGDERAMSGVRGLLSPEQKDALEKNSITHDVDNGLYRYAAGTIQMRLAAGKEVPSQGVLDAMAMKSFGGQAHPIDRYKSYVESFPAANKSHLLGRVLENTLQRSDASLRQVMEIATLPGGKEFFANLDLKASYFLDELKLLIRYVPELKQSISFLNEQCGLSTKELLPWIRGVLDHIFPTMTELIDLSKTIAPLSELLSDQEKQSFFSHFIRKGDFDEAAKLAFLGNMDQKRVEDEIWIMLKYSSHGDDAEKRVEMAERFIFDKERAKQELAQMLSASTYRYEMVADLAQALNVKIPLVLNEGLEKAMLHEIRIAPEENMERLLKNIENREEVSAALRKEGAYRYAEALVSGNSAQAQKLEHLIGVNIDELKKTETPEVLKNILMATGKTLLRNGEIAKYDTFVKEQNIPDAEVVAGKDDHLKLLGCLNALEKGEFRSAAKYVERFPSLQGSEEVQRAVKKALIEVTAKGELESALPYLEDLKVGKEFYQDKDILEEIRNWRDRTSSPDMQARGAYRGGLSFDQLDNVYKHFPVLKPKS